MIKVYLSGPITGKEDTYEKEFTKAKDSLLKTSSYYEVISPIENGEDIDSYEKYSVALWTEFMKKDLDLLKSCDAIALMKGWEKSSGCIIELIAALKNNLKVITLDESSWEITDIGAVLLNLNGIDRELANETFYRKLKTEQEKLN